MTPEQHEQVRELNDRLRVHRVGGHVVFSPVIDETWSVAVQRALLDRLGAYDAFRPENDPDGEHAAGRLEFEGHDIAWRIEQHPQPPLTGPPGFLSPFEPWTEIGCVRVLRIVFAHELDSLPAPFPCTA